MRAAFMVFERHRPSLQSSVQCCGLCCRHETETLKRQLDEEEEYYRKEKNLERNYQQDADDAQARLGALRAEAEPHSQCVPAPFLLLSGVWQGSLAGDQTSGHCSISVQ